MVKKPKVVWDDSAKKVFRAAIEYIKNDSIQNAQNVKQDILYATRDLADNPNKYPIDKYSNEKDGSNRAFELHRFRIAYHISKQKFA
jgi:plasmid stabilization system protein ParE